MFRLIWVFAGYTGLIVGVGAGSIIHYVTNEPQPDKHAFWHHVLPAKTF